MMDAPQFRTRRLIQRWIVGSIVAGPMAVLLIELTGRLVGPNADGALASLGFGAALLAVVIPLLSAITALAASAVGLIFIATRRFFGFLFLFVVLLGFVYGGVLISRFL